MRQAAWTSFLMLMCWPLAAANAESDDLAADQERQIEVLQQWLSGRFSNFHQLAVAGDASGYPALLQETQPARLEQGGEAVVGLLTRQSWLQEPDRVYRRQFATFHLPRWWQSHIRQRVYYVPEGLDVQELTYEELEYLAGCDIYWEYEEGTFSGWRGDDESCAFRDPSGHEVSLTSKLELTEAQLSIQDTAEATQAPGLFGDVSGATVNLRPVEFIASHIRFIPSGLSDDESSWLGVEPARLLHDQGQRTALLTQQSRQALPYEIEVQRHSESGQLKLRVYRHGESTPVVEEALRADEQPWEVRAGRLMIELQPEPFQPEQVE